MFYYARSDTHYLLYIYDMLRNELAGLTSESPADESPIGRVLHKSKEVSLQRYEHPFCDPETGAGNRGWYNTLIKSPTLYNGEQFAVYKAVHKWRNEVAQRDDESPVFIMTQQVLSDIARIMPTDMKALWSLLETNARGLKPRLNELFDVVQDARERGAHGPTMLEFFRQSSTGTVQASLAAKSATAVAKVDAKPLSIEELKSNRSQLWGDVALNSVRDGSAKAPRMDYREMIPLYSFDFAAVKEELPKPEEPAPAKARVESKPPAPMEDQGFTLKGGRKRKASDSEIETPVSVPDSASDVEMDDTPAAANEADTPQSEGEASDPDPIERAKVQSRRAQKRELKRIQRQAKELIKQGKPEAAQQLLDAAQLDPVALARASKKERKERKKRQQQEQQQQQHSLPDDEAASEEEDDDEEEDEQQQEQQEQQPFDYTKAASVLHAARANNANTNWNSGGGKGGKGGRRGKPAFDPYAKKSGDAPQGARKMNYERSGRTATFKK
jgi:exosome complex exonuclease RRP6